MNKLQSSETLMPPRFGFAIFSIFVALVFYGIYALVAISNGSGQPLGYYLYRVLAPTPVALYALLQASCRITGNRGTLYKHDLFTTRIIPAALIDHVQGDNGIDVFLKDGRELGYWGHGGSLIGDLFNFQGAFRAAKKINTWLMNQQEVEAGTGKADQDQLKLRKDFFQLLAISIMLSVIVATLTWLVADELRPIVNSPALTEILS